MHARRGFLGIAPGGAGNAAGHFLKAAGRAVHGGAALGEIELIAKHRALDILMDLVLSGALVMMSVGVDDHEVFVAARDSLVFGLGQMAAGVEFIPGRVSDGRAHDVHCLLPMVCSR